MDPAVEVRQMSHRQLISALKSLSPEARQQVADFVSLLREQDKVASRSAKRNGAESLQPFIGMWRDRDDLKDSSAWVRNLRKKEWPDA
jgi:hypothetical protein